jgi:hypothetical protein
MSKLNVIQNTEVGNYAWHGEVLDSKNKFIYDTFSVGIFKVVPKSSGKGKKAEPAIFRVKAVTGYEDWLNRCCKYICDGLNAAQPETRQEALTRAKTLRDAFLLIEQAPW